MRWLMRLTGLRRGEERRGLRLGFGYFLLLASMYVLKPARNALFLTRLGAENLAYVMVAVAVVGGLAALFSSNAAGAQRISRFARGVLWAFAASLALWWFMLRGEVATWEVFVFYVWVNLYGQLATALVWLLAGSVVDARESRRVFAFVGAMGILGSVVGGAFTQHATALVGTVNLLPVGLLLLLGALWVLGGVRPQAQGGPERNRPAPARGGTLLDDVRRYRLLRVLLAMTLVAGATSSVIDVQFNVLVDESLASEDQKTAFFGSFFAYLNAGAFLFQLLVTSRLMSRFGLGVALMSLPAALAVGTAFVFTLPGLVSAVSLKASDAGLRHSLYKSANELLFVPLPARVKTRLRVLLDATVDNLGTGLGALLVVGVTLLFGTNRGQLAWLSLGLIAVWAAVAARARSAHVDAFRVALDNRQIHPGELAFDLADPRVRAALSRSLASDNPRDVAYALTWVRDTTDPTVHARLSELLEHPDGEIRARALGTLARRAERLRGVNAEQLLHRDPEPEVRREAAALLARLAGRRAGTKAEKAVLVDLLSRRDPRVRAAALGAMADLGHPDLVDLARCESWLGDTGAEAEWVREELARVLGGAPASSRVLQLLLALSRDGSARVATRAMRSAGEQRALPLLDVVVSGFRRRSTRAGALDAVARYGPAAVPKLADVVRQTAGVAEQLPVVRALSRIESQASVDSLIELLPGASARLRRAVLRALVRLRVGQTALRFPADRVHDELTAESQYNEELRRAARLTTGGGPADRLLKRALLEKRQESLELVFWLLGLLYSARDMRNAFVALSSDHARARASAIEFLDNVLDSRDAGRVLPLVEAGEAREPDRGDELLSPSTLRKLMTGRDAWLRACAVFRAGGDPELERAIRTATRDPELVVREVALLSLSDREVPC